MKDNATVREAAWAELFRGRWIVPLFWFWAIGTAANRLVLAALKLAFERNGIQTWTDFEVARLRHLMQGLDFAVPSAAVERQMWLASGFELFISLIFFGMLAYGLSALALKASANDRTALARTACGGLARPLDCAWLAFRMSVQIALWSLLFIVPGIVAMYAYSQAWFLKTSHPEWSAGRCLAESRRMMKGAKARLFSLDCSYWKAFLLMILATPVTLGAQSVFGDGLVASLVVLSATLFSTGAYLYFTVGRAIFHRTIRVQPIL